MKIKQPKKVVITTLPLSVKATDAFECKIRDRVLINSICRYADELRKRDVEVFTRQENIIATSEGYYCAFYEEDLETMEKDPVSYMGKDGRMKVQLKDNDGKMVELDLATLVATQFVPNPCNYDLVMFHDGNPANVASENLYWTESKKIEI